MPRKKAVTDPNATPEPVVLTPRQQKNAENRAAVAAELRRLMELAERIAPYVSETGNVVINNPSDNDKYGFFMLSELSPVLAEAVKNYKEQKAKEQEAKRQQLDLFLADPETLAMLKEKAATLLPD